MKTDIGGNLTLRQEAAVSSEFHTHMLNQLEAHHDEKAGDWTQVNPDDMVLGALEQLDLWTATPASQTGLIPRDPKRLVHAANFLSIAWAITESQRESQL